MSATSKFARAFSLRDKGRSNHKHSGPNLFSPDEGSKKLSKDEQQKVQDISLQLSRLGNNDVPESRIQYALRSKSTGGDVKEAMRLLLLYEDSVAGVLRGQDASVKMLGAENWEKTTCWLDSLLFAMFAQTDVFEAMLHQQYEDEPRRHLVVACRLWVNMLRCGKLIPIDLTRRLQAAIAECGWPEAAKPRQQDASEAFNFITDKLSLPLLTLKTDIYHQGKEDANDDHKFITERMLDVAIPGNLPQGEVLKLESCLEDYFNNRVEVKRHLARRNTVNSVTGPDDEKSQTSHIEVSEMEGSRSNTPAPPEEITRSLNQRPLHMRERATSIFSERKIKTSNTGPAKGDVKEDENRSAAAKKEVLMPAWQFLNLIPWYTDNVAESESQVRSHFSQKRLMLGICLKRYGMTKDGTSYRRSTHIDIPLEMASPHFTTGDAIDREGTNASKFKLVLKSLVCHRGHSTEAGHYVSLVRVESSNTDRREAFADASSEHQHDHSHDTWLKLDDMALERVTTVDINRALREESPYLLFYRVQPIDEHAPDETPPPYQESETSLDLVDQKLSHLEHGRLSTDQPSSRPSIEIINAADPRRRPSVDRQQSNTAPSTNGSLGVEHLESSTEATSLSAEDITRTSSPAVSRQPTRAGRDGRAQSDDTGRFSMSMSKLAARLSRDKLNNPDIVVNEITDEVPQNHGTTNIDETPIPVHSSASDPAPQVSAPVTSVKPSVTVKDNSKKKKKFKIHGRNGSTGNAASNEDKPDRECVTM